MLDRAALVACALFAAPAFAAPVAPAQFGSESPGPSQISLSWSAPADGVSYGIERCAGYGCDTFKPVAETADTGYADSGLTPGAIYRYRVRAKNAAGEWGAYADLHFNPRPVIPAFPGAEGAGAASIGGRGGAVCAVTTLADSGPGSLRACAGGKGPRTVVFRVGGTIVMPTGLPINNPYITIAGQTAPGGGITISSKPAYWDVVGINTHNVIIRNIRFSRGYFANAPAQSGDAISIYGPANNLILDHVSARWAQDGNLDIWRDNPAEKTGNITISNSIISEPLTEKNINFGANNHASETMGDIDMADNFLYGYARNPLVTVKKFRFYNNLIYNYGWEGLNSGGGAQLDVVGNLFKAGPARPTPILPVRIFPAGGMTTPVGSPSIYIGGNIAPQSSDPAADNWKLISNSDGPGLGQAGLLDIKYRRATPLPDLPFPFRPVAANFIDAKLLSHVGASRRLDCAGHVQSNRDAVDARLIEQYRAGTGAFPADEATAGGLPALDAGTPCADTDADGMPDEWEKARGLNPNDPADGPMIGPSGYSNLELYLAGAPEKPALLVSEK